MKLFLRKKLLTVCAVCLTLSIGGLAIHAVDSPRKQTSAKTAQTKKTQAKKGSKQRKKPRETSAAVKKQEQHVEAEIKQTRKQIEENEAAIKKNRAELATIEQDIAVRQRKISDLLGQQRLIDRDLAGCKERIRQCEAKLTAMRQTYVSVIKKMRIARKQANPWAYIFSSKTFYQAWRRLRYFRKYNAWRERRVQEIKQEMARLGQLNDELDAGYKRLDNNLQQQQQAQQALASKYAEQDEVVKKLHGQGEALRRRLARKQAESDALSARVSTLIAAEQEQARKAAAAAERKRRDTAARAAVEQAALQRAAEEAAAEKAKADRDAGQKEAGKGQERKEPDKGHKPGKGVTKPADEPDILQGAKRPESTDYAEARGRRRRRKTDASGSGQTVPEIKVWPSSETAVSGFASAKGSLPRPASGEFRIVSRFGEQPVTELPNLKYDNPGIDAEVADGASAQAVYPGTVSGVYVVPGFSTVVIISHGDYYTVYGNIGKPAVKKGEQVKQGQNLGKLLSDSDGDGRTHIHFEIYKNREKLNPEEWIR